MAPPRRVRQALSDVASQRAFFGVSALLFAASAAVTLVGCASVSAVGEMPMPGGGAMAWLRRPEQTWPDAAASFLGMWVVMMVAMVLPLLLRMLWRYRQAIVSTGQTRLGWLTALMGVGYFFVWTVLGMALAAVGCSRRRWRAPLRSRSAWSSSSPARSWARPYVAGRRRHGLATRPAEGHGPSCDGGGDGSHHRRASRTGR